MQSGIMVVKSRHIPGPLIINKGALARKHREDALVCPAEGNSKIFVDQKVLPVHLQNECVLQREMTQLFIAKNHASVFL